MSAELTSPGKLLWPEAGFTKADLRDYYEAVSDRLLAQLAQRPVTLKQHPQGVAAQGFYIKNLPAHAPGHIDRFRAWTPASQRTVAYALADDVEDLRWFAQQNVVELHHWTARTDRPDRPDQLWWDLDPAPAGPPAVAAAHWLRALLDELGLAALVKTSGKRGLHVLVPVERRYTFGELRGFGLAVARACAERHPDALTVQMRKAERGDRLLLDWSRNGPAQTVVAAWSPRVSTSGSVSMPLRWEELTEALDPAAFTLATAPGRQDAWTVAPRPQRIEQARRALERAGYPSVDRSPRSRGA